MMLDGLIEVSWLEMTVSMDEGMIEGVLLQGLKVNHRACNYLT